MRLDAATAVFTERLPIAVASGAIAFRGDSRGVRCGHFECSSEECPDVVVEDGIARVGISRFEPGPHVVDLGHPSESGGYGKVEPEGLLESGAYGDFAAQGDLPIDHGEDCEWVYIIGFVASTTLAISP